MLERDVADQAVGQGVVRITLNGQLLQQFPAGFNFEGQIRSRVIMLIAGMVISTPGRLVFSFHWEDNNDPAADEYWVNIGAAPAQAGAVPVPAGPGLVF